MSIKLTPSDHIAKESTDTVLRALRYGPATLRQLECSRRRVLAMIDEKLVKRAGAVKNEPRGRKAVTYELTAKGRKRAEKL